jgi:hypothetical protein
MNFEINSLPNSQIVNNSPVNTTQNIIEVSNIYPNDLIRHNLHASQRQLISQLRADAYGICRTEISPDYIKNVFNKFKNGFVYYKDKIPVAFCIWKVKEHIRFEGIYNELYIYLICGKRLDYKIVPKIIDDVVHLCRKNNIMYISLQPANDTLKDYYIKCGFREYTGQNGNNLLELKVPNTRMISHSSNIPKFRLKTYKRRGNKKN